MFEIELFKRQKPKKYPLSIIFIILFIILIILSYNIKTYDTLNVTAFTQKENKCHLEFTLPYDKISILENSLIEYKNKKYKIKNIYYLEVITENNMLYEKINIETNLKCRNKIIKIKILNNKQRIINKIIKIIKEE